MKIFQTTLDDRAVGRENNLNLIRLLAAWAVLASHSYVLATGNLHAEPWQSTIGTTPGGIAVDTFFVISGFLVTGSLLRCDSLWEFTVARSLRIYPGLWVALTFTVVAIGFAFTDRPSQEYFTDKQTWVYFLKNSVMFSGAEADLPGAFSSNIAPSVVNGSLWTLRHELRLYGVLGVMWLALGASGLCEKRINRLRLASTIFAASLVAFCCLSAARGNLPVVPKLAAMFFSGACYQLFRKKIPLSYSIFFAAIILLAAAAMRSSRDFGVLYYLTAPYIVLFAAYYPSNKALLKFNALGDYSYGIYIYAFPIQQMIMSRAIDISTSELTVSATAATLIFAVCSWHFVEKPA